MTWKNGFAIALISSISGMVLGYILSTKDRAAEEKLAIEDRMAELEQKITRLSSSLDEQPRRTDSRNSR